jgi:hypothetical protein
MKKRIVYATAIGVAACMMFTGCGSNENDVANSDQTIEEATTEASTEASADEVATEAPAEVPTDETATEAPAEAPTDETATETPDEASVDEPAKEAPLMQAGEAVYYDGQVLFRNYSPQAFGYGALWGKFQRNSTVYTPGSLCTFDPNAPEKGITTICEDSGNGCLYLKDGNTLYSQKVTDYSPNYEQTAHVYKKVIPGGEDEEICLGEIQGFSPDGEHFVVYTYTMDPYQVHYFIYEVGDKDVDTAHYEPADGATFLTIDNDNAYFLEQKDGNIYTIVQVSNKGNIYILISYIPGYHRISCL